MKNNYAFVNKFTCLFAAMGHAWRTSSAPSRDVVRDAPSWLSRAGNKMMTTPIVTVRRVIL